MRTACILTVALYAFVFLVMWALCRIAAKADARTYLPNPHAGDDNE